ncbi:FAD-dependent monooxygenase [Roseateles amylovorans]|uniref:FAD-dependent monooxygenase n=1 Tax=Roseateles amylovorans TaxID=2978473 RepID=A0ABY6B2X0_9BURK|nr:FAD-dependent monooxygenase [Roseateles amylovorans]UXH79059.1 FAD-dependent monooxygenase [Roseateles amylovorans]
MTSMEETVLVAGGGIGGLACALSIGVSGVPVTVLEQAGDFAEIGAGIQLGPNAMRVLSDWGLDVPLRSIASYPDDLRVRDSRDGRELGHLRLGATALSRFGQPYACVHRADFHQLLREAVRSRTPAKLRLQTTVKDFHVQSHGVHVTLDDGQTLSGAALIGCDGLWSRVRDGLLGAARPQFTGHLAYRGLVQADSVGLESRRNSVQLWLGARMHVVAYPVRDGRWINLVAVVHDGLGEDPDSDRPRRWAREARVEDLLVKTGPLAGHLRDLIDAVPVWTRWPLYDRRPLRGPSEHAIGPVALLGDAAHPLRPHLAQGAAMAIEDAWAIGQLIDRLAAPLDWAALFARYAAQRWERNARVQRMSQRNGRLYHASGLCRLGRNVGLRLLGEQVLVNRWLYGGPPEMHGRA